MAYTREDRLIEAAADETGFSVEQVKQVLDLMNKIDEYSGGTLELKVIDGKPRQVAVGWQSMCQPDEGDEIYLPQSLWDKADNLDFDIVELLPAIQRAWQAEFGFPYPTLYSSRPIPEGKLDCICN